MEKLKGFENAKVMTGESTQLPKGGYVAKIMDCKEVKTNDYSYLAFSFDVAEGEHKGHFANIYKQSKDENKKWKGIHNVFIPKEGTAYYEDNMTRFKTMTANFEESNPGYQWDWNETGLKGKIIGVVYGEEEYRPDGSDDVLIITKPRYFTSTKHALSEKLKMPALKKLKTNSQVGAFTEYTPDPSEDDLPF